MIHLFFLIAFIFLSCFGNDNKSKVHRFYFDPDVTQLPISDWKNPTNKDYQMIQDFLKEKQKLLKAIPAEDYPYSNLEVNKTFRFWSLYRMSSIVGIADDPEIVIDYLGNDPNQRDKCIICYVTRQRSEKARDYIKGLQWIKKSLKHFNFGGHLYYYIGGWPGLKRGRLKYADVPYGFKPFLFEEARDMGYKNILWLDACTVPVASLSPIFYQMKENGLCILSTGSKYGNESEYDGFKVLMPDLNLSKDVRYEHFVTQAVGINVSNKKANQLLDEWVVQAEKKLPMVMGDEVPFLFLVHNLNLQNMRMPKSYCVKTFAEKDFFYWKKEKRAILYHHYEFLKPDSEVPENLFSKSFRKKPKRKI